ncbi:MAG: hypothetical protein MJZ37_10020 [Bacilli bacterium]|nr:hypothetical protein [Bacilli bacterium]
MKARLKYPKLKIEKEEINPIQVLFFYEIPILFVCMNNSKELFLVYCCDIDDLQYSIAQVDKNSLIQMLENQVAMDSLFISANKKWRANVELFDKVCTAQLIDSFEEDALPKKNAVYGRCDLNLLKKLKTECVRNGE